MFCLFAIFRFLYTYLVFYSLKQFISFAASPLSTASSSNNYKSFKDESPQAADVNSSDDIIKSDVTNSSASALMTNFSLKTPDDQWMYCDVRGCSFWTRKPERMERHRKCHRPDTKYYKCPDCSLRFYSLAKMLKHDRKVHTGVKDYECRVCEAEVTDIQIHMRVSLGSTITTFLKDTFDIFLLLFRFTKPKNNLNVRFVPWNFATKIP